MSEGAFAVPSYPAPNSIAQFGTESFLEGQSLCCDCHETCHKCNDEPVEEEVVEEAPVKAKKGSK